METNKKILGTINTQRCPVTLTTNRLNWSTPLTSCGLLGVHLTDKGGPSDSKAKKRLYALRRLRRSGVPANGLRALSTAPLFARSTHSLYGIPH
jgi:hypothetical protein